jgi:hypothetical protein
VAAKGSSAGGVWTVSMIGNKSWEMTLVIKRSQAQVKLIGFSHVQCSALCMTLTLKMS